MLYLTTRDHTDAHTIHKTLVNNIAPDGGSYIPFSFPHYGEKELKELCNGTLGQRIADILNDFFCAKVSGWDVECAIGRSVIKVHELSRRTILAETWHNPQGEYSYLEDSLYSLLYKSRDLKKKPTDWVRIAVKISVLFGIYGEIHNKKIMDSTCFDVVLDCGDFCDVMAAWYTRQMGLPIGIILCSCDDNNVLWDLIHRGEAGTVGWSDSFKLGIERLICAAYGTHEAKRFAQVCTKGGVYVVNADTSVMLHDNLFCAVVGNARIPAVINSVYLTDHTLIDTETAKTYAAIQDYRAKTGENRLTLLFANRAPIKDMKIIVEATGLSHDSFLSLCKKS